MRPDVVEKRDAFCEEVRGIPREKLIFLDEVGVNLGMTPSHARAPVGERAVCHVPGSRGSNISVIAAVRESEVIAWYPHDGAVDGERFVGFLRDRLSPSLKAGDVVVMDNVRFHHIAEVAKTLDDAGARVLYIAPYHPELNAIEEVFSVVKGDVRRGEPRSICALVDRLKAAFALLTPAKLAAFVTHALGQRYQPG